MTDVEYCVERLSRSLGTAPGRILSAVELLDQGATVPFIARYRKELTGSMDEVGIRAVRDEIKGARETAKRRDAVLRSLTERGLLTPDLESTLSAARSLTEIEDLYLPYRPKRKTRASAARDRGLEPLADSLFRYQDSEADPGPFINPELGVETDEDAFEGAMDIIAEQVSEDADARSRLRSLFRTGAVLSSAVVKKREAEAAKYRDYFRWMEPLSKAPSHRILAILRGVREGYLTVKACPDPEEALPLLHGMFVKGNGPNGDRVRAACSDAYRRLIEPSLETEVLNEAKERADGEAIRIFSANLRELLLAPPLGPKPVMAVDPGFRTGCKIAALGPQGDLLEDATIYPTTGERGKEEAAAVVKVILSRTGAEVIAVGNGTAGRETEAFLRGLETGVTVVMVDESGASVYSASDVARAEFPDRDVTVRGAVSIGRRLQDPLAELVKIDPASIGVGQYQHDVDQAALKRSLDDVVASAVNAVGVDLNSASVPLLTYVSGLGPKIAANIVARRSAKGPYRNRRELLEVPLLGARTFEQAAGFLRIRDGVNPLDASAVHPERYSLVDEIAAENGSTLADLVGNGASVRSIDPKRYVREGVGLPTINDILAELARPGRDPRPGFVEFSFAENVREIGDLEPGMVLPGIVTNVTAFGAFVDIGVHQDGLVHVSRMADRYVSNPSEVVKVRQHVTVRVLEVDLERKRIGLSMRPENGDG